jgi:hypothetical protein
MSTARVYEEIVDFIAMGPSPSSIAAFHPSDVTKERVADLIAREKTIGLSHEETAELSHYLQLEHVIRLAKARARQHIGDE